MKIAVIGAGIAGLAVANGAQQHGADVTVFEGRETLMPEGFGLTLFANGVRALEALQLGGCLELVNGQGKPNVTGGIRDHDGRWLSKLGARVTSTSHVVARADLHEALAGPLADNIRINASVAAVIEDEYVRLSTGREVGPFDLVIAADGLRSPIRTSWGMDPGVSYRGYAAWRGMTDSRNVTLALEGVGELWGHGQRFGIAPLADGRIYWFATKSAPLHNLPAATLSTVKDTFAGWHSDVHRVLEETSEGTVSALPIFDLSTPIPSFVNGRTVLIGDAAHAMTPDVGQGANQALEDAAQLTHSLRELLPQRQVLDTELTAALAAFDSARRPRTQKIALQARRMGRLGQVSNPALAALRNAMLHATPNRLGEKTALTMQEWSLR